MALIFHKVLSVEDAIGLVEGELKRSYALCTEKVLIEDALGRVLARDVFVTVDHPPFDRSKVDGYAVDASSTYGATELEPVKLRVKGVVDVGRPSELSIGFGECAEISTGAPIPRGANAVVMVEYTKRSGQDVLIFKPVAPGGNVSQTGSDMSLGDLVLRERTALSSKEVAVLAALGCREVEVYKVPKVAVFSTGDELTEPGRSLQSGNVYDVNGYAILCMLKEMGIEAHLKGILRDDVKEMREAVSEALSGYDVIITSGSTSAGFGDIIYRVFNELGKPGVLVHGIRLRPGKPTAIAVADGKLLVGLPGFPLSSMMVFMRVIRPILYKMMGLRSIHKVTVKARMAFRLETAGGREELIPVQLVRRGEDLVAYPVTSDSDAVSSLTVSDGLVAVPESKELVEDYEEIEVDLLSPNIKLADAVIIGSHCPGIDLLVKGLNYLFKVISVGSVAGWLAVKRREADIAGTHLLDDRTMTYNVPFLSYYDLKDEACLVRGYLRRIGFLVKKGNPKGIKGFGDLLREDILFINRNRGSGVRTYIEASLKGLLGGARPEDLIRGYQNEARTHTAVAAAVAQGRADVGVAVEAVSAPYGLDFIPLAGELFDFLVRKDSLDRGPVKAFISTLASEDFGNELRVRLKGYRTLPDSGKVIG